jgi:hypothetical protein
LPVIGGLGMFFIFCRHGRATARPCTRCRSGSHGWGARCGALVAVTVDVPFLPAQWDGSRGGSAVLYTLAVVLLILWLLGMVSGYTIGAFIHVLLVVALVLFLVQIISGRRPAL